MKNAECRMRNAECAMMAALAMAALAMAAAGAALADTGDNAAGRDGPAPQDRGEVAGLSGLFTTYGMPRESMWRDCERVIRVRKNQKYVEIGQFVGTTADGTEVRIGVPRGYTARLPVDDLLEILPADWPEQVIRVRAGFDGYILVHLDVGELRLTIRRLAVQPLPREREPQIHLYRKEDVDYGC